MTMASKKLDRHIEDSITKRARYESLTAQTMANTESQRIQSQERIAVLRMKREQEMDVRAREREAHEERMMEMQLQLTKAQVREAPSFIPSVPPMAPMYIPSIPSTPSRHAGYSAVPYMLTPGHSASPTHLCSQQFLSPEVFEDFEAPDDVVG